MKRSHLLKLAAIFVLFGVMVAGVNPPGGGLEVNANLSGQLKEVENKELVLIFSDDMIALGQNPDGKKYLRLDPLLAGEFTWRGTKTLAFRPKDRFRYSTRYRATVPAGITAINGKRLERPQSWEFTTPLPRAEGFRTSSERYFRNMGTDEKPDFKNIWVKDALFLRFNQPMAASEVQRVLTVKEKKSGQKQSLAVVSNTEYEVAIRFSIPLPREVDFELVLGKGLRGREGNVGTQLEQFISLTTVPHFRILGSKERSMSCNQDSFGLQFSNRLSESSDRRQQWLKLVLVRQGKEKALSFSTNVDWANSMEIFGILTLVPEQVELLPGDLLKLRVSSEFENVHNERLGQQEEVTVRVCSSSQPFIDARMESTVEKPEVAYSSIQSADASIYKFSDEILYELYDINRYYYSPQQASYGFLTAVAAPKKLVEREASLSVAGKDNPESLRAPIDFEKKLDSKYGFFGFLPRRALPFNHCQESNLFHFPINSPFNLQVVLRRSLDFMGYSDGGQTLVWAFDQKSGAPVAKGSVRVRRGNENFSWGETSADGLLRSSSELLPLDWLVVRRGAGSDLAFTHSVESRVEHGRDFRVELFSERQFYRPGDEVHIGGIVKEYVKGALVTPTGLEVRLQVFDPGYKSVLDQTLSLDEWGGLAATYRSDPKGKRGSYSLSISGDHLSCSRRIQIDYYQPNTFEVGISGTSPVYTRADTFASTVSGSYLAGNPMAGDKMSYSLAISPWSPIHLLKSRQDISGFRFDLDEYFQKNDNPLAKEKTFDREGLSQVSEPLNHFRSLNHAASLQFTAIGKSAEGKEYSTSTTSLLLPGSRLCGLKVPYCMKCKSEIKASLLLLDRKGAPAAGSVSLMLYLDSWKNGRRVVTPVPVGDEVEVKVGEQGATPYAFRVQKPGDYLLKATARDAEGNLCCSSASFYAWDYSWSSGDEGLRLTAENTSCRTGDEVTCYLQSPKEGWALVTVESDRILESKTTEIKKTMPLTFTVKKEFFPVFTVRVHAYIDRNIEEASLQFQVRDDDKRLQVNMQVPKEVKPASAQKVRISVRDPKGKGRAARLFVFAVDEGNLSLTGYQTPGWHDSLYYRTPLSWLKTFDSRSNNSWEYRRPLMDITLDESGIFGCIVETDGTPAAGARVTIREKQSGRVRELKTTKGGYYYATGLEDGEYTVQAQLGDRKSYLWSLYYNNGMANRDLVLLPAGWAGKMEEVGGVKGGVMGGVEGGALTTASRMMAPAPAMVQKVAEAVSDEKAKKDGGGGLDVSGIKVRTDFREVLFFSQVKTDERGEAAVDFQTSDQLSTYRLMVVAYSEDAFGSAEQRLLVTKDVLLSEAMPEFARQDDRFTGGVQLSNRTKGKLDVQVLAEPTGIAIHDQKQKQVAIDAQANLLVPYTFKAGEPADAQVTFYAVSSADKDGLLKKFPVTDNLVPESQLDFDMGKDLSKRIHPLSGVVQPRLLLTVAPSILRPAVKIAEKLVFYPYECLEQRTSKVMPYLLLSEEIVSRMDMKVEMAQIKKEVEGYIRIIPEFQHGSGGLSYYRGSDWASEYLSLYVLWALQVAKRSDYAVDPGLVSRIEGYLKGEKLKGYCQAFYQFVLSLDGRAEPKVLKEMYEKREQLGLPGRVFLYRALGHQLKDRERQKTMVGEFKNGLQVEADFAYFDAREFAYDRDLPFYSSRYGTALLLQALLEWEPEFTLAPRVMNWLLEAPAWEWHTTQTNFWVLYAVNEYIRKVEKGGATKATLSMLNQVDEKKFATPRDAWKLEKGIAEQKADFDLNVNADQMVYLTTEYNYKLKLPSAKSRGIKVMRNVYGEDGRPAQGYKKGKVYQVELLLDIDKEVPYAVVDEPLAAGFEVLRQDIATTRKLKEFNTANAYKGYGHAWLRPENGADRTVFYTYLLQGRIRVVYFIKAMYAGEFTWLPTVVQGMYHPQYFGRSATQKVVVSE